MRVVLLICAGLALGGCPGRERPSTVVTVCPTLKLYSKAFQAQVAGEMRAVPPPGMAIMVKDYGGLRAQVRACQDKAK